MQSPAGEPAVGRDGRHHGVDVWGHLVLVQGEAHHVFRPEALTHKIQVVLHPRRAPRIERPPLGIALEALGTAGQHKLHGAHGIAAEPGQM
jgi:hypothetical protein